MKTELTEDLEWAKMSPEEKKKQLFLRQNFKYTANYL